VGVIGPGRVGAVLGAALDRAGHRVVAVTALSAQSRARVEALLPAAAITTAARVVAQADLVVVGVPEPELGPLVSGLSATQGWRPGQVVVHTSARHGVSVLSPVAADGASPLALHPAMRFGGVAADLIRLSEACFAVTCDEALRPMAEALVIEMGAEPVWVTEELRPRYAAAAAHAADHLGALLAQASEVLLAAGVRDPRRLLGPLTASAADAALAGDTTAVAAASRGDRAAVAADLAALAAVGGGAHALHLALSRASAAMSMANGDLSREDVSALLDLLADTPGEA
jgi:predicted short-subunit dehydrogenase-like oxidoreductase (DUF2520 family)